MQSVSTDNVLRNFLTFLKQVKNSTIVIPIVIGHNSATFDVPILLRNSDTSFKDNLIEMNIHFADNQDLMKELIKGKHKALISRKVASVSRTREVCTLTFSTNSSILMMHWRTYEHWNE